MCHQKLWLGDQALEPFFLQMTWRELPLDPDTLGAQARLMMPRINIQAPPNLSDPHYDDLLDGAINDWGGVSPLTPDFINPEKPWPHLEDLRRRTEAKGFELRQRLPVYPEFMNQAAQQSAVLARRLEGSADAEGYVRRAA